MVGYTRPCAWACSSRSPPAHGYGHRGPGGGQPPTPSSRRTGSSNTRASPRPSRASAPSRRAPSATPSPPNTSRCGGSCCARSAGCGLAGRTRTVRAPPGADCTLSVPGGRVVGLVGPNGAGKSTLLQLAAG
ncbi:ATP-binding cassette domain-containing protein [Streptomyces chrestomyceticus]